MFTPEKDLVFEKCLDHREHCFLTGEHSVCRRESHQAREILLVLEGRSDFFLNGRYYDALPGHAFFIESWIPHQQGYPADVGDIVHVWVHLHEKRMFAIPCFRGGDVQASDRCIVWEFPECMHELVNLRWDRALRAPESLRRDCYCSIAGMLFEEILFQCQAQEQCKNKEDSIVSYIRNYIVMNHGRDASMAELEKRTGYNRRHLMRRFKEECSMTIGEYIDCVRRGFVSTAGSRMTQKEIAFQLGFKSPAAYWLWKKRDQKKMP